MEKKIKKIKQFLLCIIMLFSSLVNAQEFYVSNNEEIQALASKGEITRIAFDAPVTEVHSLSEEIEYVINGKDIFLRVLNSEKPINFFVKCEDESTYKLLLIADDISANQIFIHNKSVKSVNTTNTDRQYNNSQTEYFGQISPELKTRIAKIIEASLTPSKHLNYQYKNKNSHLFINNKNLKAKLETLTSGNQLIAEKIRLINKSDQLIKLDLKDFADFKYLAIYLHNKEILPNQETILIRILDN